MPGGRRCAQVGDKAGEAQVPIVPANLIPPSPPLTAEEALRSFKVAPGYRIELVAEARWSATRRSCSSAPTVASGSSR
ncbi:hypothetical protein EMGBS6_13350 [Opitutia bacterium]|nr:hypothetical protein EMGBS6_13350 [Opitutae bacterium]